MRYAIFITMIWSSIIAAKAEQMEAANLLSVRPVSYAVAAVVAGFETTPGQSVRVTIYQSEADFLIAPYAKREAVINEQGLAVVALDGLAPGEYALAAYLDENGDGKLNRGKILGRPKEPFAFSNGVVPKLRKPRFDEAKVSVKSGDVVYIELDD